MRKTMVLLMVLSMLLVVPVAMAAGVSSSVQPLRANVRVGRQFTAAVVLNGSGVGSYSANLSWNPAVLKFRSYAGSPPAGWTGIVNDTLAADGKLRFNGVNIQGSSPSTTLMVVTFDVVGMGVSSLDLEYTAMAQAVTFQSLLPGLVVRDGSVWARR